jgi:RNA polymerase sigma factor (sigma-70 family)
VFRVAFLIVRDTRLAEVATRSTFVRAYRALPLYDDRELALLPWFIRIAAGESRQQRRESGRPSRSSRPVENTDGPRHPATALFGISGVASLTPLERGALADAFDRLGEDDRLVIAARYLLGLSRGDAADALSLASGLVEQHLRDAIGRLRSRMASA